MDLQRIGSALASLATDDYRIDYDSSATGGYDQWVASRVTRAYADYTKLANGTLHLESARRRWEGSRDFIINRSADIVRTCGEEFLIMTQIMVVAITDAFTAPGDTIFDPSCPDCGEDMLIAGPHFCTASMDPMADWYGELSPR